MRYPLYYDLYGTAAGSLVILVVFLFSASGRMVIPYLLVADIFLVAWAVALHLWARRRRAAGRAGNEAIDPTPTPNVPPKR